MGCMGPDDPWLAAVWPFVRGQLPPAPATVLEVGCGTLGGFVPALHHVADLEEVLDRLAALLVPGGGMIVVEWAWERFDEPTARWCFARLAPPDAGAEPGWLHGHRERWVASGRPWDGYRRAWATEEGLHPGEDIMRGLDARFDRQLHEEAPYFFAALADTSEAEEQAAIDAGQIRAGGIRYAATRA
jgi:SAM-dependent methyltransferase